MISVGKARVRVIFSPEPKNQRVSIDTVIDSIDKARESVIFRMFDPTDPKLISSLLAVGDKKKILYGMLNSIADPNKKKDTLSNSARDSEEVIQQKSVVI